MDMIRYCIIQYTLDNNRTQPRHRTGVVLFPIGAGDRSLRHDSHWIQLNPELHRGLKWSNHFNRFGHFHLVHLLTTSYNFAARLKQRGSTEYTMLTSKSSYCRVFPRNHDSPAHPLLTSTLYIILYKYIYIHTVFCTVDGAMSWECKFVGTGDLFIPGGGLGENSSRIGLQVVHHISTVHLKYLRVLSFPQVSSSFTWILFPLSTGGKLSWCSDACFITLPLRVRRVARRQFKTRMKLWGFLRMPTEVDLGKPALQRASRFGQSSGRERLEDIGSVLECIGSVTRTRILQLFLLIDKWSSESALPGCATGKLPGEVLPASIV